MSADNANDHKSNYDNAETIESPSSQLGLGTNSRHRLAAPTRGNCAIQRVRAWR